MQLKYCVALYFIVPYILGQQGPISLQWAICDQGPSAVFRKLLNIESLPPPRKEQNITYFDLSPPKYTALGVAFRTKIHKKKPVSLVKLRALNHNVDVPGGAKCRWDRYGNESWFTCGVFAPRREGGPLWSSEQVAFASQRFDVKWDKLAPYGPFLNPKWKFKVAGRKVVFDTVEAIVDGRTLHLMEIEVTIKCNKAGEAEKVYEVITHALNEGGVELCKPYQLPKTLRLFDALRSGKEEVEAATFLGSNEQHILS